MCGIAGVWCRAGLAERDLSSIAGRMGHALAHRGPDGDGLFFDAERGVALSHRRLSIIDLSPTGAQPMMSHSGRFVMTFNGELYGYQHVRRRLEERGAQCWRGTSDTEVLLEAFAADGVAETLQQVDGMFALAVWDRALGQLTLACDRFGEKPLYYGLLSDRLLFGSELGAIRAVEPLGEADIDPQAIAQLLQHGCIGAPLSIFRGVSRLAAGRILTLSRENLAAGALPPPAAYWCATEEARKARLTPFQGGQAEIEREAEALIQASVRERLVADVPVGLMLSGGVDSSCIAAVAQTHSGRRLQTYTIGFDDPTYDESAYAEEVAAVLGTDHTTIRITASQALAAVEPMVRVYDEPFADSSQVVTALLSSHLRRNVTVALSGDGGDEIFGGYHRYLRAPALWQNVSRVPQPVRMVGAAVALAFSHPLSQVGNRIAGGSGEGAGRLRKALAALPSRDEDEFLTRLLSWWPDHDAPSAEQAPATGVAETAGLGLGMARRLMLRDTLSFLPDDILTKVDRASMAVGLEVRSPLLDAALFRFAWSLPDSALIRDGLGKLPLRAVAARHLPAAVLNRPKQGFAVPFDAWLRGPLRSWADDLLDPHRLRRGNHFDSRKVEQLWRRHRSGEANEAPRLWPMLMFEAWRETLPAALEMA